MNERAIKKIVRFLKYAIGFTGELRTQIYIVIEIGYIEKQVGQAWILETTEISKMLSGYMKSVLNRI